MYRMGGPGTFTLLLLGVVMVGTAHTQTVMPVTVGQRVRVTAPGLPQPLHGRVTKTDPAAGVVSVTTIDGNAEVTLPLSAVSRIDVSRGRSRPKIAWVAGLVVGGSAAVGTAVVVAREGRRGGFRGAGGGAAAAFGGTGFVIGSLAGYAYAPERWRTTYDHQAADGPMPIDVGLATHARVKRFADGTIAVAGERDRRRGIMRGAAILGAVALVFGGIDRAQGEFKTGEYLGTVAGNLAVGGAIGYLLSPRGWQKLPWSGHASPARR